MGTFVIASKSLKNPWVVVLLCVACFFAACSTEKGIDKKALEKLAIEFAIKTQGWEDAEVVSVEQTNAGTEVLVAKKPGMPGGHVTIVISSSGKVLETIGGGR